MTKHLPLLITISSILSLTACKIDDNVNATSTVKPSTPIISPNTPNQPVTTTQTEREVSGESFVAYHAVDYPTIGNTQYSNEIHKTSIHSNDERTLNIDGKTFAIVGNENSLGFLKGLRSVKHDGYDVIYSMGSYNHVRYGRVRASNPPDNLTDYHFYHGVKTPITNIPTTSKINYVGHSIHDCHTCEYKDKGSFGTSQFTADFDQKTLTGSVKNASIYDYDDNRPYNITLNATISGNTFSGTSSDGVETSGAFFGDQAQEIGGLYHDKDQKFKGVFGAIKQ